MIYGGWTRVRITRSIEHMAGTFDLQLTERYPAESSKIDIQLGTASKVAIDGETVITGYVFDNNPSFNARSREVAAAGRDVTGDLVDCSAINRPGEWLKAGLQKIVTELAKPFGIPVRFEAATGAVFAKFRIEEGETAFEAIDRACRMRSLLAISDGRGSLVITKPGVARAGVRLEEGVNLLSGSAGYSQNERFSRYIVKAQQPGSDDLSVEQTTHVVAEAADAGVTRYRPMLILAEDSADRKSANDRAKFEANVRAARSQSINVKVQGWRESEGGPLWSPNRLVSIKSGTLKINQEMLISQVVNTKGSGGTISELTLLPPAAFDIEPVKEKKAKGSDQGALQWIE
tara:strand:- start:10505 stop:11542 length:1038 start_codon:yes stop_codon:yes gene_type:complete